MTQPTGVFVRLPLSEERAITFHKESSHAWDEFNGSSNALACEAGLLAIGTPVTGGSLIPIGEVAGHFSDGQAMVRILNHPNLPYKTEISLYSDAQAAIAALEAEVGRLREALEEIEMGIDALSSEEDDGRRMAASEMKRQALEVVRSEMKALKGREA